MPAQRKYPSCAIGRWQWCSSCVTGTGRARGEIVRMARQLGVHREVQRTWVRPAEIDGGTRPGTT
jgi:transposase